MEITNRELEKLRKTARLLIEDNERVETAIRAAGERYNPDLAEMMSLPPAYVLALTEEILNSRLTRIAPADKASI